MTANYDAILIGSARRRPLARHKRWRCLILEQIRIEPSLSAVSLFLG